MLVKSERRTSDAMRSGETTASLDGIGIEINEEDEKKGSSKEGRGFYAVCDKNGKVLGSEQVAQRAKNGC